MNILVIRNDKLGDFITALPAIFVLKKYNPKNRIIVCVAPLNKALAESCEFIDEVLVDSGQSVFELSRSIASLHLELSITLFSTTRIALALLFAKIPARVAPATKIAQIFYNKRVKQRRSQVKMAEFEYNLEILKVLFSDIDLTYKQPLLDFSDSKEIYEKFCQINKMEKEVIAFHVGFGGSSDANWNLDEYEVLIKEVLKQKKYQVVLSFGPGEEALHVEMKKRLQDEDIVYYLSLDGLIYFAKLISNFKLFVSTSTGTYHLASLVGTPTMTFFGSSLFASAKRWKSVGEIDKQKHFMIPLETKARSELFNKIKMELATL